MNNKTNYNIFVVGAVIVYIIGVFILLLASKIYVIFSLAVFPIAYFILFKLYKVEKSKAEILTDVENRYKFINSVNRKIINNLDYALVVTTIDFEVIQNNDKFFSIFNLEKLPEEPLNLFLKKISKNIENFEKKTSLLKNKNPLEESSVELILKDNSIIKTNIFYINNEAAAVKEEFVFLFKDYTDERKSSTNFEILVNNIDEMVAIFDVEMKIVKYNAAFRKFFYDFENIEVYFKANILENMDEDKAIFWEENFGKGLRGEKVFKKIEYISKDKNKKIELNIDITSIYNSSVEVTGFILSIDDITNIKNLEKEIELVRNELRKTKKIKEKLIYNLSSEIRTPLNNIISGIELINGNKTSKKESEISDIIQNSGKDLLKVLNDISDYLKIESEMPKLKKEIFDIESEILSVFSEFETNLKENSINFKLNSLNIINSEILGDKVKFEQIINNVLKWIIDITNSKELEIIIEENINQDIKVEYYIFVKPTDVLIENNKYKNSDTISILIAEKYIEAMNGKIFSKEDKNIQSGYKFSVFFDKITMKTEKKIGLQFSNLNDKKVLIVEDNRMNQVVMQKLLKIVKINSEIAENGEIALEKYKNNEYDLILMDIQMPIMNGYETAKNIREYEKKNNKQVPIIALTAYAMQSDREKCIDAGMDDYMSKPVIKNELFEMLEKYIKRNN